MFVAIYTILVFILVSSPPIKIVRAYIIYEDEWKWTLVMQVHAPRYGRAEGTASWSVTTYYTITGEPVSIAYTFSVSGSWSAYPEDGYCTALIFSY